MVVKSGRTTPKVGQVTLPAPRGMAERGLKAAAAGALSVVLLVLLAGAWAPSSAGGHVELQQRAALQRLPARRAAMRKQRATALWATQDNGVRFKQLPPNAVHPPCLPGSYPPPLLGPTPSLPPGTPRKRGRAAARSLKNGGW